MKASIAAWLDAHASPAWRQWTKLHSTWTALFWFVFWGFGISLYAWSGTSIVQKHPALFMLVCMISTVTWGFARLTKQPGVEGADF